MSSSHYTFSDFVPLILIMSLILAITLWRQVGIWNLRSGMLDFMGFFFIIFGVFKLLNWTNFVHAYMMYDLIAQRSIIYAYAYPLIEVGLGIAYLLRWQLFWVNIATAILMTVSGIGVGYALYKGERLICACLGMVFRMPMTYITLAEDLCMAIMAITLLLI